MRSDFIFDCIKYHILLTRKVIDMDKPSVLERDMNMVKDPLINTTEHGKRECISKVKSIKEFLKDPVSLIMVLTIILMILVVRLLVIVAGM